MAHLSQADVDTIEYAQEFAKSLGVYFFPEELHPRAFGLVMGFGKIALSVRGTEAPAYGDSPEVAEKINKIADCSLQIGGLLMRKIPVASLARLERDYFNGRLNPEDSPQIAPELTEKSLKLSPQYIEIVDLISRGLSVKEIAEYLNLPRSTVVGRLQSAYQILDVHNSPAATIALFNLGQLPQNPDYELRKEPELTLRQSEIMSLAIRGLNDEEISKEIGCSKNSVTDLIHKTVRDMHANSRADAIRYLLQKGQEVSAWIKEATDKSVVPFLGEGMDKPQARYGMYAEWLAQMFIALQGRRVTMHDVAKVLYGEEYSEATADVVRDKARALVLASLMPPGKKGRIAKVSDELVKNGLQLSKFIQKPDYMGRNWAVAFLVAHPKETEISPEELDNMSAPTDVELREVAITIRRIERNYSKSTVPKAQTRSDNTLIHSNPKKRNKETNTHERDNNWSLKTKELETFGYLAYGLSDNEISQKVGRSKAGVHGIIERILEKTASRNRTDAAVLAYLYSDRGHQIFEKECKLAKQLETRQLEVLEHIYEHTNRQQLADALGIKPSTLTWHINKINKELGTVNGVQLSLISYQLAKDQAFKKIKAERELTIYEQQQDLIRADQEKKLHKRAKAEIKDWRAEENIYILRDERQLARYIKRPKEDGRTRPSSDEAQPIAESKKEDSPKRPSTMSLDNLAEDGFPIGFVEQIEELEEKLRHPPPHAEIVKILRASGW